MYASVNACGECEHYYVDASIPQIEKGDQRTACVTCTIAVAMLSELQMVHIVSKDGRTVVKITRTRNAYRW